MRTSSTRVLLALLALSFFCGAAHASTYLYAASPYNVFVRDSFSDYNADTWGAVASGGTVTTSGGFGFASHGTNLQYAVIAAVDFTATGSGRIDGNLYDGTPGGINSNFTVTGTITNGNGNPASAPIDFADAFAQLGALSTSLGAMATTPGDSCTLYYGTVKCYANASGLNVINISLGTTAGANFGVAGSYDIGNNYGIEIHATDPNATIVINIAGSGQQYTSGSGFMITGIDPSRVLVNYYQATSLILGTSGITASLLAPFADVKKLVSGGNFDGNFIAKSFTAGPNSATEEFHSQYYFKGELPQPQTATPEPASLALLAGGIGVVVWRQCRRR